MDTIPLTMTAIQMLAESNKSNPYKTKPNKNAFKIGTSSCFIMLINEYFNTTLKSIVNELIKPKNKVIVQDQAIASILPHHTHDIINPSTVIIIFVSPVTNKYFGALLA